MRRHRVRVRSAVANLRIDATLWPSSCLKEPSLFLVLFGETANLGRAERKHRAAKEAEGSGQQ